MVGEIKDIRLMRDDERVDGELVEARPHDGVAF
jgi:hypothetical protein